MNDAAAQFRESRIDVLSFLGAPEEQIAWQNRTPSLDSTEFMCWWLDDFYPDSNLFTAAFSKEEIEMLTQFNALFCAATDKYPGPGPKAEVLLQDPDWLTVVAEANRIAEALKHGA